MGGHAPHGARADRSLTRIDAARAVVRDAVRAVFAADDGAARRLLGVRGANPNGPAPNGHTWMTRPPRPPPTATAE